MMTVYLACLADECEFNLRPEALFLSFPGSAWECFSRGSASSQQKDFSRCYADS